MQTLEIDQREYVEELLEKFSMAKANPAATPMLKDNLPSKRDTPNAKWTKLELQKKAKQITEQEAKERSEQIMSEINQMKKTPYRGAIGGLSHLCRLTRPDLQFATFYHSRYQSDPGVRHWQSMKRIFRYLRGTTKAALTYDKNKPFLEIYCDADWGGDPDKERSTIGIIMLMKGLPIYHKSRVQVNTAKSTANAELIALCDCTEETIWIKGLLDDFGLENAWLD